MANELRVRQNFASGTITNNPLLVGGTTLNSAALASLSAIGATQHLAIVLDPTGLAGAPEIVWITAHTGAATSATILRGQEGTVARQHASGTIWRHAPTTYDYPYSSTVAARPATPYFGQIGYDTDTDTVTARSATGAWQPVVDLGVWDSWTPVITQGVTPTQTVVLARYTRMGRTIHAHGHLTFTGAGTAATDIVITALPATSVTAVGGTAAGSFRYFDTGNTNFAGTVLLDSAATTARMVRTGDGNNLGNGSHAIASGDRLQFSLTYEAAS